MALECLAEQFGPQLASRVLKAHGPKASKFLKLHSEDDQDHTQQAYQHLRNLSAEDSLAVKQNLILSAEIYRSMLIDLGARLRDLNVTKHAA